MSKIADELREAIDGCSKYCNELFSKSADEIERLESLLKNKDALLSALHDLTGDYYIVDRELCHKCETCKYCGPNKTYEGCTSPTACDDENDSYERREENATN